MSTVALLISAGPQISTPDGWDWPSVGTCIPQRIDGQGADMQLEKRCLACVLVAPLMRMRGTGDTSVDGSLLEAALEVGIRTWGRKKGIICLVAPDYTYF